MRCKAENKTKTAAQGEPRQMPPVEFSPSRFRFCVVVHDVTPFFASQIERLLEVLQPLIGNALAGAVVPRWGGATPGAWGRRWLADGSARFGELVLHGWTHRREAARGVVSWCTDAANEFEQLSPRETLERLRRAQFDAKDLFGRPLRGFVPPAWRLGTGVTHLRSAGIEYLMRFRSLETCGKSPVPLATWSWDWGWLPGTRFAGEVLGTCCRWLNPRAVPAVALHPRDVDRGCLPAAQRLICRLLSSGLVPILPGRLMTSLARDGQT
jgi:hypothetical protein